MDLRGTALGRLIQHGCPNCGCRIFGGLINSATYQCQRCEATYTRYEVTAPGWPSGEASDCKSEDAGSNPAPGSIDQANEGDK